MTSPMPAGRTPCPPAPLLLPGGEPAARAWTLSPGVLHINHGSFGAVPALVQREQNALRARMDADPVEWFTGLPARVARAREEIAARLGAAPAATALVPNASAGASVVFDWFVDEARRTGRGDVVVTDHGYGAVSMGADRAARRAGGELRRAAIPLSASPEEAAEAILDTCSPATGLLVLDQITSSTARRMPVEPVARAARERGIRVLVDGAHSPGMLSRPVAEADFWVGNLHKFACAPRGAAVLVAARDLRQELHPVIDSWGASLPYPERFDHQGTLDVTSYLVADRSAALIEEWWGWDHLRRHVSALADHAEALVTEAFTAHTGEDHRVEVGAPVAGLRLIRLPAGLVTTREQADALRDLVVTGHRAEVAFTAFGHAGYARLSVHAYNTARDYEEFAERIVPLLCEWAADRSLVSSRTDPPRYQEEA